VQLELWAIVIVACAHDLTPRIVILKSSEVRGLAKADLSPPLQANPMPAKVGASPFRIRLS
jgi:hypothetical protein